MAIRSIGAILVQRGVLREDQLQAALDLQKKERKHLGELLVEMGAVSEEDLLAALSEQMAVPYVMLSQLRVPPEIVHLVPPEFALQYKLLPFEKKGDALCVGMVNPFDVTVLSLLRRRTGLRIEQFITTDGEIMRALKNTGRPGGEAVLGKEGAPLEIEDAGQVIRLVESIVESGLEKRASDIHVEPDDQSLQIRYRVDGILQEGRSLPVEMQGPVVSRLKVMANLDISKKRVCQDGRFRFTKGNVSLDVRVSTLPTVAGEKVVMRLLNSNTLIKDLKDLGLDPSSQQRFQSFLSAPYGIVFVTGPTGSGKTTTLYTVLRQIHRKTINIVTVEDPVEYRFPGMNQVQVDALAGVTFQNTLPHILRQDPDVILVGEVRDADTAALAIQAALTGHLVFASLHTNDAPSSVVRLIDMGIQPFLIASALVGAVGQRLVRRLCDACKVQLAATPELLGALGAVPADLSAARVFKPKGCPRCYDTGYAGRVGLFEVMPVGDSVKELVQSRASLASLRAAAVTAGMSTLRQDGARKALKGLTSIEEVLAETQGVE